MMNEQFWNDIKARFEDYENIINALRFADDAALSRLHLSRATHGESEHDYDAYYYPLPDKHITDYAVTFVRLGIPIPGEWGKQHQEALAMQGVSEIRPKLSALIVAKELSAEFIKLWAEYNFAMGAVLSLMQKSDLATYELNIIQNAPEISERCFYAFWMMEHWVDHPENSKDDAQYALADRIEEILSKEKRGKMPVWKIRALQNMINKKDNAIKPALLNLSKNDIRDIVATHEKDKHLFVLE